MRLKEVQERVVNRLVGAGIGALSTEVFTVGRATLIQVASTAALCAVSFTVMNISLKEILKEIRRDKNSD